VQQNAKQLEQERRAAQAANREAGGLQEQVDVLRRDRDELRSTTESLGREQQELARQNAQLLLENVKLEDAAEKLQNESTALAVTSRSLTAQIGELAAAREADAAQCTAELEELRARVAAVLQRMFDNQIDEAAAAEALNELGCEVEVVPHGSTHNSVEGGAVLTLSNGAASAYSFKPRLVLDDPGKMARLMRVARSQGGSSSPRLLVGGSSSNSGSLTPRASGMMTGSSSSMQSPTLVMGAVSSAPGTPRFVLSWLGGGGGVATSGGSGTGAARAMEGAGMGAASDAGAHQVASSELPDAVRGKSLDSSPTKAAPASSSAPVHVEQQGGTLVFSPQSKVRLLLLGVWGWGALQLLWDSGCGFARPWLCNPLTTLPPYQLPKPPCRHQCQAKMSRSRLGLSLTDAASVFKSGSSGSVQLSTGSHGGAASAQQDSSDVGGTRDLVTRS